MIYSTEELEGVQKLEPEPKDPVDANKVYSDDEVFGSTANPEPFDPMSKYPSLLRSLVSGLSGTAAGVTRLPGFALQTGKLFSETISPIDAPRNLAYRIAGFSPAEQKLPDWTVDNSAAKYLDKAAQSWAYNRNKYANDDFLSLAKKGRIAEAGDWLMNSVVENAPYTMLAAASTMAGHPEIGLATLGGIQGANTFSQAKEKQLSDFEAIGAGLTTGYLEAAFEQVGTFGLLKWGKELYKDVGEQAGKTIFKNTLKYVLGSSFGEGNEEFWTQLTQDLTNKIYGVEDTPLKDMPRRALLAGITGFASGATMTAPSGVAMGLTEQSNQKRAKALIEKYKTTEKTGQETTEQQAVAIGENVRSQLVEAGTKPENAVQYAKLTETMFKTMAERSGMTPQELYDRYKLNIRGPENALIEPGEGMEQPVQMDEELAQKAVDRFGTTQNLNLAGYVLPDGRMIDFAEKGDARLYDHRTVAEIYGERQYKNDTEQMRDFMGKTGAVRIGNYNSIEGEHFSVEAQGRLSREQVQAIGEHFDTNKIDRAIFEVVDEAGHTIKHESLRNPTSEDVGRFFLGTSLFQGPVYRLDFNTGEMVEAGKEQQIAPPTPAQVAQTPPSEPGKLTDVGEELWYNRRNLGRGLKWDEIKDANDTIKSREVQKAKIWPREDYEQLVEQGMNPFIAYSVKVAYDSISPKPSVRGVPTDAQLELYTKEVARVKEAIFNWAKTQTKEGKTLIPSSSDKSLINSIYPPKLGQENVSRFSNAEYIESARLLGGNKFVDGLQPGYITMRRAEEAIAKGWPKPQEDWERKFDIRESPIGTTIRERGASGETTKRVLTEPEYFVTGKNKYSILAGPFKTEDEAITKAKELAVIKRKKGFTEETLDAKSLMRKGPPRRPEGVNVQPKDLQEQFGFRGVNYGNWVNQEERQSFTNQAYDALLDMAELLNIPPKAVSLNGLLGLAFGAQGRGASQRGAAAHFVPGVNEINLTKKAGAGSLAHEWAHALDHYFAVQAGEKYAKSHEPFLTHQTIDPKDTQSIRPEILNAFKDIVSAMESRNETPEEVEKRIKDKEAISLKQLDLWIKSIRRDLETDAKPEEKESALRDYDAITERLRIGDIGEGYQETGNKRGDMMVHPTTGEIYRLFKDATGKNPRQKLTGMDHWAWMIARSKTDEYQLESHKPQLTKTSYAQMAEKKESSGKPYWSKPTELFARAFQSYTLDQLENEARRNDYLTRPQTKSPDDVYPVGLEREKINNAFDVLFKEIKTRETERGIELYQPSQRMGEPRGRIQFGPSSINIDLLKGADLSTFLHETGHFYLKMMGDLSSLETAKPDLKADAETIKSWLGAESFDNLTTDQHEQFARGFEAYLMEGKAPTSALKQAFENFKKWLIEIYKTLKNLNVELTDEVRGVFDRALGAPVQATEAGKTTTSPPATGQAPTTSQYMQKTEEPEIGPPTPEPIEGTAALPIRPPNDRWVNNPGSIPGEPILFLDGTTEDNARAAIIERQDDQGGVLYELMNRDGQSMGIYQTVEEAAKVAEENYPKTMEVISPEQAELKAIYERATKLPPPTMKTEIKKDVGETWDNIKTGFNKIASSISSRLAAINPSLKYVLRGFEYEVIQNTKKDLKQIMDLVVKSKSMEPADRVAFDLARKNGDETKIKELAKKYDIDMNKHRKMMDDLFARAKAVGYEAGYIENYHPRKVKDAEGLNQYFKRDQETWSAIEDAITQKEAQLTRVLNPEERAQIINLWMRGYGSKLSLSKPSNLKGRRIKVIDEKINQFYEDADTTLIKYVTSLNEAIAARNFFGKEMKLSDVETDEVRYMNVEDTVGAYVNMLREEGKIKPEQENEVRGILQARFGYRHSPALLGLYKNITYMDTLGSVISAVTQLEDVGVAMYKSAVNTPGSLVRAVMKDSKITMDDLGIEDIWEELKESKKSSSLIRKMFKLTGFSFMDRVGKETLVNTVIDDYRNQVRSGNVTELEKKLTPIFEEETDAVLDDLGSGRITDNVLYLAFNELLDVQPVALSEMPQKYLESPGGRFFYTLKSFMIKRIDFIRNEALSKMASSDRSTRIEGVRNFLKLWFTLGIFGAGPDLLKNLLLNRDTDYGDLLVDNLLKPFGLGKWFLYMARREGIGKAVLLNLLPPMKALDSIYKDITVNIPQGKKMEIPASIPLGGKLYYWWFGKGADKKKKGKRTF